MADVNWSFIFVPPGLALTFWLLRKLLPAPAEAQKPEVSLKKEQFLNYAGYFLGFWLILVKP